MEECYRWRSITSPAIVSGGTVSTYTDSGITYQVNTFTSDGTLNVSSPGVADMLSGWWLVALVAETLTLVEQACWSRCNEMSLCSGLSKVPQITQ